MISAISLIFSESEISGMSLNLSVLGFLGQMVNWDAWDSFDLSDSFDSLESGISWNSGNLRVLGIEVDWESGLSGNLKLPGYVGGMRCRYF